MPAAASSISGNAHPLSPVFGPHVHDVPLNKYCHSNGGLGRLKYEEEGEYEVGEKGREKVGRDVDSFTTVQRRRRRPSGMPTPTSLPFSHAGACVNVARTREPE
eukprot:CAMPEP_0118645060 /NCGR_PEP_ID=MMETSP0785-20121206/7291_1 /TAXON_ID=91992 /ORGANISM="Bolidomonas pacifica, Strain CCMP 1866" /LENGTH=103 /DNA_ID=CAMNT_0006536901 /DNA_START=277 /DNA_END=589 /DNA_ORIENTATION=+